MNYRKNKAVVDIKSKLNNHKSEDNIINTITFSID